MEPLGEGDARGIFGIDGESYPAQRVQATISDKKVITFAWTHALSYLLFEIPLLLYVGLILKINNFISAFSIMESARIDDVQPRINLAEDESVPICD